MSYLFKQYTNSHKKQSKIILIPSIPHKKKSGHKAADSLQFSFRVEDTGYFEIIGCLPSAEDIGQFCQALEVQLRRHYKESQREKKEKRKELLQRQIGPARLEGQAKRERHTRQEGEAKRERHERREGQEEHVRQGGRAETSLPSFLDPQLQLFEGQALNDWHKIEPLRRLQKRSRR